MTNRAAPAIKATMTMAPTTPPAIAPAFELLCGFEVGDELDPDGLEVDWVTVDVGTMEAVPVTSGESRPGKYSCVQRTRVLVPPSAWAAEMFQVSLCGGTVDEISWGKQAKSRGKVPTDVSM